MVGYKINDDTYDTILMALADNRILKIEKMDSGKFRLREACDHYFSVELTPSDISFRGEIWRQIEEGP